MWSILILLSFSILTIFVSNNQTLGQQNQWHSKYGKKDDCSNNRISGTETINVTSTEVAVRWACCSAGLLSSYNLEISGYNLYTYKLTKECFHTFSSLCPNTSYEINVSHIRNLYRRDNDSIRIDFKTDEDLGNVTIKEAKIIKKTAVYLKWQQECPNQDYSQIVYNVTWSPDVRSLLTQQLELTVGDLKPGTTYTFVIRACNATDHTTCCVSRTVLVSTLSGVPSAPRDLKVVKTTSGEIYLKWKPPLIPNAEVTYYCVQNVNDESQVCHIGSILHYRLQSLVPDTNYTFSVYAYNLDDRRKLLKGAATTVNYKSQPQEPSVAEIINLLRLDAMREFSKMQALLLRYLPREESDARNETPSR